MAWQEHNLYCCESCLMNICKLHRTAFHQGLQGNSSMFSSVKVAVDFEECCSTGSALILLGLIKLLEVGFHFSTFSIWICVLVLLFCPYLSGLSSLMIMQQSCRSLATPVNIEVFQELETGKEWNKVKSWMLINIITPGFLLPRCWWTGERFKKDFQE